MYVKECFYRVWVLFIACVFGILGFVLDTLLDMYVKVTLLSWMCCSAFISAMAHMCFLDILLQVHISRGQSGTMWNRLLWCDIWRDLEEEAIKNIYNCKWFWCPVQSSLCWLMSLLTLAETTPAQGIRQHCRSWLFATHFAWELCIFNLRCVEVWRQASLFSVSHYKCVIAPRGCGP